MTGDRSRPQGENPLAGENASPAVTPDVAVLRRTAAGWTVGDEDVPDLTCAMVLADLIAAELPGPGTEPSGAAAMAAASDGLASDGLASDGAAAGDTATGGAAGGGGGHEEARRLRVTIGQLERALAVRIRVEQAIGVLAERHRVRPRQAFEQLRSVARGRGQRVIDIAGEVIASATNPLLPLPEELCRPSMAPRPRSRNPRRAREAQ
jgi:ANTAR domain